VRHTQLQAASKRSRRLGLPKASSMKSDHASSLHLWLWKCQYLQPSGRRCSSHNRHPLSTGLGRQLTALQRRPRKAVPGQRYQQPRWHLQWTRPPKTASAKSGLAWSHQCQPPRRRLGPQLGQMQQQKQQQQQQQQGRFTPLRIWATRSPMPAAASSMAPQSSLLLQVQRADTTARRLLRSWQRVDRAARRGRLPQLPQHRQPRRPARKKQHPALASKQRQQWLPCGTPAAASQVASSGQLIQETMPSRSM
jgi:hypothetical protein